MNSILENNYGVFLTRLSDAIVGIDLADENGLTALMMAAGLHGTDNPRNFVSKLIKSGASLDQQNNKQMTALMIAAERGNDACVELLINHGANVNLVDRLGQTALHKAVKEDYVSVVKRLVKVRGIDLDVRDAYNKTAASIAIEKGYQELISVLRDKQATIRVPNDALPLLSLVQRR